MANPNIDLYRIAVMSVNELTRTSRPVGIVKVELESLKALIDTLLAKLPEEDTLCDSCILSGRRTCYHKEGAREAINAN